MPKTQHRHYRTCSCFLQQIGSPLLGRGKKPVTPQKNVHHSEGARMHPGIDTPVSLVSYNRFNVLPEECLFSLTLSPISSSSRKRSCKNNDCICRRMHLYSHISRSKRIIAY